MSKKKIYDMRLGVPVAFKRQELKNNVINKVFNWYASKFDFPSLDYQTALYLKRSLFFVGKVAEIPLKDSLPLTPIFTKYAPVSWNLYDFPIEVTLINKRGVPFIPSTPQLVDRDCVLWFAQKNHQSIYDMVEPKINMIVETEMAIAINEQAIKTPFVFEVEPQNMKSYVSFVRSLQNDELAMFLPSTEARGINALVTGAPYLIDKLVAYREKLENEIKEYLGINSLPISEKKEHLITNEIDVNDEVTEFNCDALLECLKESSDMSKEILGIEIPVRINKIDKQVEEKVDEDEEEAEEDENI